MPFVKIDCGILNSTLWIDRDQRDVFLTAIFMAEPRELLEPMPQYEVNTLNTTGWVVPPGWYGFVEAAGPGIVRRALVTDLEGGMAALRALGEPDIESRSQAFEGRRLVRVNGGYVVLNFMAYRERDYGNAERCRRYRERVKSRSTRMSSTPTPMSDMQAEAEAEAEAEAYKTENTTAPAEPAEWVQLRARYPKRAGSQPWSRALKAARARLKEGSTWNMMLEGAQRYARFLEATGKLGTEYVMQAATFLGPDKHYLNAYDPPAEPEGDYEQIMRLNAGGRRDERVIETEPSSTALGPFFGPVRS